MPESSLVLKKVENLARDINVIFTDTNTGKVYRANIFNNSKVVNGEIVDHDPTIDLHEYAGKGILEPESPPKKLIKDWIKEHIGVASTRLLNALKMYSDDAQSELEYRRRSHVPATPKRSLYIEDIDFTQFLRIRNVGKETIQELKTLLEK